MDKFQSRPSAFIRFVGLILVVTAFLFCHSCQSAITRNRVEENNLPPVILWAWERPEDLHFLDPKRFGVAFLAQTLTLKDDEVQVRLRRQPLRVAASTKLIAVTRIESRKTTGARVRLSDTQRLELVERILSTLELQDVSAIQIDFDVVTSERAFYRELLRDLRNELPDSIPLSMTALASFCVGDGWLKDLPVDEAVPMVFRMGTDANVIKSFLAEGNDFRGSLCRRSYGISLDEPVQTRFGSRRVYVFNNRSWVQADVARLEAMFALSKGS